VPRSYKESKEGIVTSITVVGILTDVLCFTAIGLNVVSYHINVRARRVLKDCKKLEDKMNNTIRNTIADAWRGGLEQAANVVAALLEQPEKSGTDPATLLRAESVIHDIIRELKEQEAVK
jgi:hypothetical protein